VNLKVVGKTTKCRDFTAIFPVFSKMHSDFADFFSFYRDFLTVLVMTHAASRRMVYATMLPTADHVAIDVVCGGQTGRRAETDVPRACRFEVQDSCDREGS